MLGFFRVFRGLGFWGFRVGTKPPHMVLALLVGHVGVQGLRRACEATLACTEWPSGVVIA